MKGSIKYIASFVGIAGLSFTISLPALAQSSPNRSTMPDAMPGMMNQPGRSMDINQSSVSAPASSDSMSIASIVDESSSFEMLNSLLRVAALNDPGLASALDGSSKYTVFAPTDEAFAALPANAIHALVQPQNRDLLVRILSYHVVSGEVPVADASSTEIGRYMASTNLPPSGDLNPNENPAAVDRSDVIEPNRIGAANGSGSMSSDSSMQHSSMQPSMGQMNGQMNGQMSSNRPPSGELRPNENPAAVDRSDVIEPNRIGAANGSGSMSSPGGTATPSDRMDSSRMDMGQMSSNRPPSGELRPNENPAAVDRSDVIEPNRIGAASGSGSMSSPGGTATPSDRMDSSRMDMGQMSSNRPPSGELRPNENPAAVDRSDVIEPNRIGAANGSGGMSMENMPSDRSMSMGEMQTDRGMMNGSMMGSAQVISADIQAENGIIHAIDRVIIPPAVQAELQAAIAADTASATPRR